MLIKRIGVFAYVFLIVVGILLSQEYHGITGLIQTPNAEIDSAGTFRGNISWVDEAMLPVMSDFGDGLPFSAPCYTIGLSAWKWLQLSYTGVVVKIHPNGDKTKPLGYYNQDRHVNVKFIPLFEGKWWPAIAVGMDDIGRLDFIKRGDNHNNHFQNIYIAGSKTFVIKGHELGVHLAYRYLHFRRPQQPDIS